MKLLLIVFSASLCISAAAQQPTTHRAERAQAPFTSIASIAAVVPSSLTVRTGGQWNVIGVEEANEAVKEKALNRAAKLRLKVEVFQAFKEEGWGYRLMAPDDDVPFRGTKLAYRIWAYFRPDQAEALSKVRKGSTVILTGTLGRADIKMFDGRPILSLDLHEAEVAQP